MAESLNCQKCGKDLTQVSTWRQSRETGVAYCLRCYRYRGRNKRMMPPETADEAVSTLSNVSGQELASVPDPTTATDPEEAAHIEWARKRGLL